MTALNKQSQQVRHWSRMASMTSERVSCVSVEQLDEIANALEAAEKTSAARLEAIDRTHKMFQRERDRAEAAEKRIAELQIARDKCFLSGLKTGWEYGIADDTKGYNREISDAQAVIDRAAGIGVKEE